MDKLREAIRDVVKETKEVIQYYVQEKKCLPDDCQIEQVLAVEVLREVIKYTLQELEHADGEIDKKVHLDRSVLIAALKAINYLHNNDKHLYIHTKQYEEIEMMHDDYPEDMFHMC